MNRFQKLFRWNFRESKTTFNLGHINVRISEEINGIRLTTKDENWLIAPQTVNETKTIIEKNFKIIKDHFYHKAGTIITEFDLNNLCLIIALHYFHMYNHWRTMYKRETNRDLTFIQKDFGNTKTINIVIGYFKNKYPLNYEDKCMTMLNMTDSQLRDAVIRKHQYENM